MSVSADGNAAPEPGVLGTVALASLGLGLAAGAAALKVAVEAGRTVAEMADRAPGAEAVKEALQPWADRGVEGGESLFEVAQRTMGAVAGVVIDSVDLDAIMSKVEVTDLVFQTTGGLAGDAVDFVRGRGVAIDRLVGGITDRILRRDSETARVVAVTDDTRA
jgi:hypothetical protein